MDTPSAGATPAGAAGAALSAGDRAYKLDETKLEAVRRAKPWLADPKHFKKARVSAAAAMKMTTHAAAGVEKGLSSASGMPIEVMGLLVGHIDTETPGSIIVTDVCPLPVEGTETTVMADNPEVQVYMVSLADQLEATREEGFIGWYHSHPFDVGTHSNAFLSATDVSTQLGWQLPEDRAGIPWLALVVDPLRGVAKGKPEIGAFRCYPPAYTPPKGTAPDGVVWGDEKARNARWGDSCVSYYQLETEYFVPTLASSLLSILARDFLWTRVLSSTPMLEKESRDRVAERLRGVTKKLDAAVTGVRASVTSAAALHSHGGSVVAGSAADKRVGHRADLAEACAGAVDIAGELCRGHAAQLLKDVVFNVRAEMDRRRAARGGDAAGGAAGAATGSPSGADDTMAGTAAATAAPATIA